MAVITIVGARGGAGSSTLALNLARYLMRHDKSIRLIDEELWVLPDADQFETSSPDHTITALCRHEEGAWLLQSDQIVVLVPAEVRAVASAAKLLPTLERHALCSLVVRLPGPSGISATKIESLLKTPLAAVINSDPKIATLGEHGMGSTKSMTKSIQELARFLDLL